MMREWYKLHEVVPSIDVARGITREVRGSCENQKSLLGRGTAHNPNASGGERGERLASERIVRVY